MKKKLFFLFFAIGGVLLLAYIVTKNQHNDQQSATLNNIINSNKKITYSFQKDNDSDGLSNAEEMIYGSKAEVADTDGDGYLDGDEVKNGYDPIVAGSARLDDRKNQNITIQYFSWLRKNKGITEPEIKDNLIIDFLSIHPELLDLENVDDNLIKIIPSNNKDTIRTYLANVNKIGLPEGVVNYGDIIKNLDEEGYQSLNDLLGKIELSYLDFSYLKTPLSAKKIQRGYLEVIKTFSEIFSDLKQYQQNPIQIQINIKKANKLIEKSQEIERLKLELIKKYGIS